MGLSVPIQYRSFLPRFYRLAIVSVASNMMVPLAGLFDAAFLGHLSDINYLAGVILGGFYLTISTEFSSFCAIAPTR